MTATPIPRTLAMTAYADLDVSVIDELPPGRTPVKTVVLPETRRDEVVARIHAACRAGRQAYWVCPLIDESELVRTRPPKRPPRRWRKRCRNCGSGSWSFRSGLTDDRVEMHERDDRVEVGADLRAVRTQQITLVRERLRIAGEVRVLRVLRRDPQRHLLPTLGDPQRNPVLLQLGPGETRAPSTW